MNTRSPRFIWLGEAQHNAFIATRYCESTMHFVWHYHPEMELVWIRQSRGIRYAGSSTEPFANGDLCLVGENLPHAWGTSPEQKGVSDWTVLHFRPELWGQCFWNLPELRHVAAMLKSAKFGLLFEGHQKWRIGRLLEQLAERPAHTETNLILVLEILRRLQSDCHTRSLHARDDPLPKATAAARLRDVIAFIGSNSTETLTEASVAGRVKMSPAAFSRWFKRNLGQTFQHHLNHVRVAKVCLQLVVSEDTITDIAFACGFNNLANFNRRFREITGRTPRDYRTHLRHMEATAAAGCLIRLGEHGVHHVPPVRNQEAGFHFT